MSIRTITFEVQPMGFFIGGEAVPQAMQQVLSITAESDRNLRQEVARTEAAYQELWNKVELQLQQKAQENALLRMSLAAVDFQKRESDAVNQGLFKSAEERFKTAQEEIKELKERCEYLQHYQEAFTILKRDFNDFQQIPNPERGCEFFLRQRALIDRAKNKIIATLSSQVSTLI